jgi:pilus assembly protein Flp/PilA
MQQYLNRSMDFLRDEGGATATEYGLLACLIAVAIVVGASAFGMSLSNYYAGLAAGLPF